MSRDSYIWHKITGNIFIEAIVYFKIRNNFQNPFLSVLSPNHYAYSDSLAAASRNIISNMKRCIRILLRMSNHIMDKVQRTLDRVLLLPVKVYLYLANFIYENRISVNTTTNICGHVPKCRVGTKSRWFTRCNFVSVVYIYTETHAIYRIEVNLFMNQDFVSETF